MLNKQNNLGSRVAAALLCTEFLPGAVIEVEEVDGVVTLIGTISSQEGRTTAEALAQEQMGVIRVVNNLVVSVHPGQDSYFRRF
jgi:osmotically-inducible protein OsmY